MALTPVEIRHLTPPRTTFRGYQAAATEKLLEEIAASFEDVWRERADLADKVEQLETDLVRFRELENLLRTTLVSAEQASAHTRDQARREAELILSEAHAEAREIQRSRDRRERAARARVPPAAPAAAGGARRLRGSRGCRAGRGTGGDRRARRERSRRAQLVRRAERGCCVRWPELD